MKEKSHKNNQKTGRDPVSSQRKKLVRSPVELSIPPYFMFSEQVINLFSTYALLNFKSY